ncbi:MAG: tetratricopeptide repeat protein, partial [Candidatus Saccharimonas sp.]|nr:tetratricopeptide repeat protein [Planctomycetaceae bacterium]
FLLSSRRHDELRKRLLDEATAIAVTPDADTHANEYFLAEYLVTQGQQVLQANENISLSNALQKVYERQRPHLDAAKTWQSHRVSLFEQSGQSDKAVQLSKRLAGDFPHDAHLQYGYAQALARSGDFAAAYAWLDRVLVPEVKWESSQEEMLRAQYADLLQQQGRYRELADYLAAWIKRNPETESPYAQYLSALVRSNQAARAETLTAQWLREGRIAGEMPRPVAARLGAAIAFATGQGYNLSSNRVEEHWHPTLSELALFFARHDAHLPIVGTILQSSRFSSTDAARVVRKALANRLVAEIDTMSLAQIDYFVTWVWSDSGTERDDWKKVAAGLRKRWDAEKKPDVRHRIAQPLYRVLSWLSPAEVLSFLRVQWKEGSELYSVSYAHELFTALLAQLWTAEIENEAFALLDKLADPEKPADGLFTRVAALHRLTDTMLEARFQALLKTIEHPEKLTRTELQKKHEESRKSAREGFSDRLRNEAARHAQLFGTWLVAERVWIDILLDRDLKSAADECWAVLSAAPFKARPDDDGLDVEAKLDELLRERFLVTLQNLAARKGADAALVERLMKYVDQQLKDRPEDPRWRTEKYRLLIALDRAKELEAELVRWVAGADSDNRWRLALGYLLAEQGKVPEAIKQFELVEASDELSPSAYRSLSEWYLVEKRREQHDKAHAAVYKTTDEYQLSRRINVYLHPWQSTSGRLPSRLDPEVRNLFRALFEKSATPQSYLGQLQQFYQASHDFELLSMLPDGVVGHTAGKVYPFLQGMLVVLGEVRDEATADELVARIKTIRPSAKTAVDARALDLLELMVERRAAELQNQAGPHAERALAALHRAFTREWATGEPRLMADFLSALGSVPQPAISTEQLRQLEVLHRGAVVGSFDRLHIAHRRAETLNAYSRRPDATDLLHSALKEFEDANSGVLPTTANPALAMLISFTETAGHYERGEKVLLAQLKHPVHVEQKYWLIERLNELCIQAMQNKGDVSLGTGPTVYSALERKLLADMAVVDQNHRYRLLGQLTRLYCLAHALKVAGVGADLKTFAFKLLPAVLKEQSTNYDAIVRDVADTLYQVVGPRDGIAFLLDRAEDEPDWLRYTNQDGWNRHGYRLGEWRTKVKNLGDLEPRLLKFVLAELRHDLRARTSRSRGMSDRRYDYYWAEKEADFAKVAEEFLAGRKESSSAIEYGTEYLFYGLAQEKRAIEILVAAHEQKVLAESGQVQLIDYLHRTRQFAESIRLLLPLVESRPDNIGHHTRLMHAYFRTDKQAELLALLKQTDAYFHEKDRWGDAILAALAESCLENRLFAQSAAYYEELIPRHQRANPHRGNGDANLSSFYANAARAYAGLGKTKQAVDMASGAAVSWGPNHEQRKHALEALVRVLADAFDLAAYVAELDKEKMQSAVVRKAIGQAYIQKNDHARAIPLLQLASELQPDDTEIYAALLACYDKIGDSDGAVRQLLRAVELSRRDIKLFEQLGQRYVDLNQPGEAERAYTSVVEMLPSESESHALLAEIREKQKRWPEAITHWERVVEIRALEPTGLIKLAGAQIEHKDWDSATQTLRKIRSQTWPPRFNDLQQQTRELEKRLDERSKR